MEVSTCTTFLLTRPYASDQYPSDFWDITYVACNYYSGSFSVQVAYSRRKKLFRSSMKSYSIFAQAATGPSDAAYGAQPHHVRATHRNSGKDVLCRDLRSKPGGHRRQTKAQHPQGRRKELAKNQESQLFSGRGQARAAHEALKRTASPANGRSRFWAEELLRNPERSKDVDPHIYCFSYTCCNFASFPSIFTLVLTVTVFPSVEM